MSHAERPKPGDRIDGYELVEFLGAGGMGCVFRARRSGRDFALKLMLSEDAESRVRLEREAEAAARLPRHPGLVRIHGARIDGDRPYLAFELVEGETLQRFMKQRLARVGPLEGPAAIELVRRLAEACAVAHRSGVTHRDIKPGNVMIDEAGQPRLLDLGLARVADLTPLTRSGMQLGTPGWMAPEQIEGRAQEIGPAVDTRALVLLLVALVCGRNPYAAATELETSRLIFAGPEPALEACPDHPGLASLIRRGLAISAAERFADADALLAGLEELDDALGDQPRRSSRPFARAAPVLIFIALALGLGLLTRGALERRRIRSALTEITGEAITLRRELSLRNREGRLRQCLLADFGRARPDLLPAMGPLPELPEVRCLQVLDSRLRALEVASDDSRRVNKALAEARECANGLASTIVAGSKPVLDPEARRIFAIRSALSRGEIPPKRGTGEARLSFELESLIRTLKLALLRRFREAAERSGETRNGGLTSSAAFVPRRLHESLVALAWIEGQALGGPQASSQPRPPDASLELLAKPENALFLQTFQGETQARLDDPDVSPESACRLFWRFDALLGQVPGLTRPTMSGERHDAIADQLGAQIEREGGDRNRGRYRYHRVRWFRLTPGARLTLEDLSLTSLSMFHTLSDRRTPELEALYEQCLQASRAGLVLHHTDILTQHFGLTGLIDEGLLRYPREAASKFWLAILDRRALTGPRRLPDALRDLWFPRVRGACLELLDDPTLPRELRGACSFQLAALTWRAWRDRASADSGRPPPKELALRLCGRALESGLTDPIPVHRLRCEIFRWAETSGLAKALALWEATIRESGALHGTDRFSTGRFRATPRVPLTPGNSQVLFAEVEVERVALALINGSPAKAREHIRKARSLSEHWDTTRDLCHRLAAYADRELIMEFREELRPLAGSADGRKCIFLLDQALQGRAAGSPGADEPPRAPAKDPPRDDRESKPSRGS